MPDVTFTVDGKKLTAPAGTLLIDACRKAGIEIPAFCYYPGLSSAGRLPHVRRAPGKSAQAANRLHHHRRRGPGLHHRVARDRAGAQGHHRTAPRQPPARLPRLRRRRRVRVAGHDLQVRRRRKPLRRGQAPSRRAAVVARRLLRPPALHPLLPLHPHVRRRHGRVGARHPQPRRQLRHRAQSTSRPARLRAVRHVHRRLPRGRAHQRQLSLQDAALGDEPRLHRLHALRRRLQGHSRRAPDQRRLGDRSRRQSRQERHQRRLPLRQGPLRLRFRRESRSPDAAARPQRAGQARTRHLGTRDSRRRRQAEGDSRHARRQRHRRHRLQPHHQRRELPAAEVRAHGAWHQQHRPRAHRPTTQPLPAPSPATPAKPPACATSPPRPPSCSSAAIRPTSTRCSPGCCAPMCASTARASTSPIPAIKLDRQAKATLQLPADGYQTRRAPRGRQIRLQQGHPRRRIARRHLRRGVSRRGRREPRRLGPQARPIPFCPLRLSRRPRELARRSRHGSLP